MSNHQVWRSEEILQLKKNKEKAVHPKNKDNTKIKKKKNKRREKLN